MPCGNIGDDDDDVGDVEMMSKSWWDRLDPQDVPDDPNSFMYIVSDGLGDAIDFISDTLVNTAAQLSAIPVFLYMLLTGNDIKGGCAINPDEE